MKRLFFVVFMVFVSLASFAQDDASDASEIYVMNVYLSDSTKILCSVTDIDSIVYNVAHLYDNGSVNLGLSVKWAACNIGASSPEKYGNYYAWGEIETKDDYSKSTSVTYGVEIDDISGNATYDAATANWGGTWRMPTSDEMQELVDSCTWVWATLNDVNGYLVIGPNDNSIFLPAAGYRSGTSLRSIGSYGEYWSSTPLNSQCAYYLEFKISDEYNSFRRYLNGSYVRSLGFPIRPVTD